MYIFIRILVFYTKCGTDLLDEDLTEKYHEANEEIKVLKEKLIEVETKYEQENERLKLENEDLSKKFGYFGYLFKK